MRFGRTLRQAVYPPWRDRYIDYDKLKGMLREDQRSASEEEGEEEEGAAAAGGRPWTEEDENRFCDEVFNVQLEKVALFQEETVTRLRARVDAAFARLQDLAPPQRRPAGEEQPGGAAEREGGGEASGGISRGVAAQGLRELEAELDAITNEVRELKRYSNLNYTGFLKIVKKHDRVRGARYRIRPMMQVSLAQRPFNSEQGYAPLLNKLSLLYFAVRQHLEGGGGGGGAPGEAGVALPDGQSERHGGEQYTAHKCEFFCCCCCRYCRY